MMTGNLPTIATIQTGKTIKILRVTGDSGMCIPEHISTKEAVVIIQHGSAVLTMNGHEYPVTEHQAILIPRGEPHTLQITEALQALVVMETDSQIKFSNS